MLRVERIDLIVSGTVSILMSRVKIIIEMPGLFTTELIATRRLRRVCHQASQTVPISCNVVSYAAPWRGLLRPCVFPHMIKSLDRVNASVVPGVAAHDAPRGHPAAFYHPILLDCFVSIVRAGRIEAARVFR